MTERKHPRFARWLLMHGYRGIYRDCLDADLLEEYQRGRSRTWYWREVFVAIVVSKTARMRDRPRSLLNALLNAFAVLALGAGTLAWASVATHSQAEHLPACASGHSAAVTACVINHAESR